MYTHISRFLHHTLSYSGLTRISRLGRFANLVDLDHRVKPDGDRKGKDASLKPDNDNIVNAGRSMVEMLGVLAIIGVLSVGAISGYSKAMFKYKLNKQTTQIGYILDYLIANQDALKGAGYHLKNILNKLGVLPNEMIKDNTEYAYDVFNSRVKLENHRAGLQDDVSKDGIALGVEINSSNNASEICRNFMTMAKARADDVSYVYVQKQEADESYSGSDIYYGNQATGKNNYLRNMDMVTMDNTCKICADSNYCFVFILIGYDVN